MKWICNVVMLLSGLPVIGLLVTELIMWHRPEYDLLLVVGALCFSGALVGRCVLEAVFAVRADSEEAASDRRSVDAPVAGATPALSDRG